MSLFEEPRVDSGTVRVVGTVACWFEAGSDLDAIRTLLLDGEFGARVSANWRELEAAVERTYGHVDVGGEEREA